jgi:hypothetical protein
MPSAPPPSLLAAPFPGTRRRGLVEFLVLGGGTLALFPLAWLARRLAGLDASETFVDALAYHAAVVINNPHFAVTYLLFYEDARKRALGGGFPPGQRARYVVVGLLIPLLLLAWAGFAWTRGSPRAMGLMIELMFFLVGWHYVKQGFGILTVFSARRGFRFNPLERAAVLGHCFAGWAYAWASPAVAARSAQEKGVIYTALAHPIWLEQVTRVAFGLSALALIAALARRFRLDRQLPPFAPLLGFLVSIWLWTVYSSLDPLMLYLIPALHSIQYGYVVWLLRRNEARAAEGPPLFGRPAVVQLTVLAGSAVALGWVLFRGGPSLLDGAQRLKSSVHGAPSPLGDTPFLALIFVFVNIHHYFMDTVLWRRENPQTRYLLSPDQAPPDPLV